jgi:hypothetical protein
LVHTVVTSATQQRANVAENQNVEDRLHGGRARYEYP